MGKNIYTLNMHERIDIDGVDVMRVPGGWVYLFSDCNIDGSNVALSSVFVPFKKNDIPNVDKKKVSDKALYETEALINYWNKNSSAIKCVKCTDELVKLYFNSCKRNTKQEIKEAIDNYKVILADASYYFNTRWDLKTFLKQSNTIPDLHNNGVKWLNYKATKEETSDDTDVTVSKKITKNLV